MGMFKIQFGRHVPATCLISELNKMDYFVMSPGATQGQVRTVFRLEGSYHSDPALFKIGRVNGCNLSYVRDEIVYPVNVRFKDGVAYVEYKFD